MPYYDDDGNELDPASVPMPPMCLMCEKKDDFDEEILCNLNRLEQREFKNFKCEAFVSLYGALFDDIVMGSVGRRFVTANQYTYVRRSGKSNRTREAPVPV